MHTNDDFYESRHPARPLKVVLDNEGCSWICDASVDEGNDLEGQGCWRCSEVQFTRND